MNEDKQLNAVAWKFQEAKRGFTSYESSNL